MPNPYGVPEISPADVAARRSGDETFILLDVREANELLRANLGERVTHVPLSELAARQNDALPPAIADNKAAEIIVFCHHGVRSAQVAAWLMQQGWGDVWNLAGGIDAYARDVDPAVGFY